VSLSRLSLDLLTFLVLTDCTFIPTIDSSYNPFKDRDYQWL
jgi:hypothetical protein